MAESRVGRETRFGRAVRFVLLLALVSVLIIAAITGCNAYLANPAWDPLGLHHG